MNSFKQPASTEHIQNEMKYCHFEQEYLLLTTFKTHTLSLKSYKEKLLYSRTYIAGQTVSLSTIVRVLHVQLAFSDELPLVRTLFSYESS